METHYDSNYLSNKNEHNVDVPSSSLQNLESKKTFLKKSTNSHLKDDSDAVFALDEDMVSNDSKGINYFTKNIETNSDDSTDETFESSKGDKMQFKIFSNSRQAMRGANRESSVLIAASLPVNISRRLDETMFENQIEEDSVLNDDETMEKIFLKSRGKKILSSQEDEMYRNMQAYSRSIQPADDPERLFGERPHRRYRPTEQSGGGSNNSNCEERFKFSSSSLHNTEFRTGCSMPFVLPVVAKDLNLVTACRSNSK